MISILQETRKRNQRHMAKFQTGGSQQRKNWISKMLFCKDVDYNRTQSNFINMIKNSSGDFAIYAKDFDFLRSLVCDFATIDVKIHPMLINRVSLPPLE